jgi:amino acid transporter
LQLASAVTYLSVTKGLAMTITTTPKPTKSGLRSQCLPFPEVLAQSIANIAPTLTPTVNLALVYASTGNGSWLAYVIATIGLVFVSLNINQFAQRSASPGSLYAYTSRGLGPMAGVIAGWGLILGYLFTAMAVASGFANYGNILLGLVGIQAPAILLLLVCISAAWFCAYKDIRLSTVLMLGIEAGAVGLILVLAAFVLTKNNFVIDTAQLTLQGVTPGGLGLGLVLAVFSYVGFESATALGDEAKEPLKFIPRSVILSTVISGSFFIVMSYVMVLGFQGYKTTLDKTEAPLNVLSSISGAGFLGVVISIAAMVSLFACTLASINAASRVLFSMSRHGIFPNSMGAAHTVNETPHIAATVAALMVFSLPALLSLAGIKVLDIYGYTGTIATYGFLVCYILISVAAPVYLKRENSLKPWDIAVSALAVLFMMVPVVGSVYPVPAAPYNVFPYLFLVYMAIGIGWFLFLRSRSPQMVEEMERDLEAIDLKFTELRKV